MSQQFEPTLLPLPISYVHTLTPHTETHTNTHMERETRTDSHTHTQTHTHRASERDTEKQSHTHTHTDTGRDTQTDTQRERARETHTHTHSYRQTQINSHTVPYTHIHRESDTNLLTQSHTQSHTHSHTLSHSFYTLSVEEICWSLVDRRFIYLYKSITWFCLDFAWSNFKIFSKILMKRHISHTQREGGTILNYKSKRWLQYTISTHYFTSKTFISNMRLKMYKSLATFKQNSEVRFKLNFKQQHFTLCHIR